MTPTCNRTDESKYNFLARTRPRDLGGATLQGSPPLLHQGKYNKMITLDDKYLDKELRLSGMFGSYGPLAYESISNLCDQLEEKCDSELEKNFFYQFYCLNNNLENIFLNKDPKIVESFCNLNPSKDYYLFETQFKVGKYKADFKITKFELEIDGDCAVNLRKKSIVIEVDGHDFHEKTKEQVKKDKARDRFFLASGLNVMRFSGSEIYNDLEKCVDEVTNYLSVN